MHNQVAEDLVGRAGKKAIQLCWHIIGEYPPQPGGVSDYTAAVATGLASEGDEVHVWRPDCSGPRLDGRGVVVHRELGGISLADLRRVGKQLDRFPAPRRLLVQWVPQGFGYRSMNVGFCFWLWRRAARHGDKVEIMAHEPYLSFRGSLRLGAAAAVHRLMTILLLRAAEWVWVSNPEWERCWRPYAFGRRIPFVWLPIPSTISVADNPRGVHCVRQKYAPDDTILIGHFATYGQPLVEPILLALSNDPVKQAILLMGMGSEAFREELIRKEPRLAPLVHATGALDSETLSCHAAACDLLIQPFPDGVSARRTSVMMGLSHGKPIVTTTGHLTESVWKDTGALALAPVEDREAFVELVRRLRMDAAERRRMGQAARELYERRFDIRHTIAALRERPSSGQ